MARSRVHHRFFPTENGAEEIRAGHRQALPGRQAPRGAGRVHIAGPAGERLAGSQCRAITGAVRGHSPARQLLPAARQSRGERTTTDHLLPRLQADPDLKQPHQSQAALGPASPAGALPRLGLATGTGAAWRIRARRLLAWTIAGASSPRTGKHRTGRGDWNAYADWPLVPKSKDHREHDQYI